MCSGLTHLLENINKSGQFVSNLKTWLTLMWSDGWTMVSQEKENRLFNAELLHSVICICARNLLNCPHLISVMQIILRLIESIYSFHLKKWGKTSAADHVYNWRTSDISPGLSKLFTNKLKLLAELFFKFLHSITDQVHFNLLIKVLSSVIDLQLRTMRFHMLINPKRTLAFTPSDNMWLFSTHKARELQFRAVLRAEIWNIKS